MYSKVFSSVLAKFRSVSGSLKSISQVLEYLIISAYSRSILEPAVIFSTRHLRGSQEYSFFRRKCLLVYKGRWPLPLWICWQILLRLIYPLTSLNEVCRVHRAFGSSISSSLGISRLVQLKRLMKLTTSLGVLPHEVYQFRLFDPERSADYFVFQNETVNFHWLMNRFSKSHDFSSLQDKLDFGNRFSELNFPVAPILQVVPKGNAEYLLQDCLRKSAQIFVKSRNGFGGAGYFSVVTDCESMNGRLLNGERLIDAEAVNSAFHSLVTRDDVLIQPLLSSDLSISGVFGYLDLPVLRVITLMTENGPTNMISYLQVSCAAGNGGSENSHFETSLYVDERKQIVRPFMESQASLVKTSSDLELRISNLLNSALPWEDVSFAIKVSLDAHAVENKFWAVAWDWALSSPKPVLLEGNVFFDLRFVQLELGPAFKFLGKLGRKDFTFTNA